MTWYHRTLGLGCPSMEAISPPAKMGSSSPVETTGWQPGLSVLNEHSVTSPGRYFSSKMMRNYVGYKIYKGPWRTFMSKVLCPWPSGASVDPLTRSHPGRCASRCCSPNFGVSLGCTKYIRRSLSSTNFEKLSNCWPFWSLTNMGQILLEKLLSCWFTWSK